MSNPSTQSDKELEQILKAHDNKAKLNPPALNRYFTRQQLAHLIAEETNTARETDQYGNPMIQLNMYEAKAVGELLTKLASSNDRHLYDTGDWFLDVPRKIAQKLATLKANKGDKK